MKRSFLLTLLLSLCLPLLQAETRYAATQIDGLNIEFNKDFTKALIHHVKRGVKYNSWYIYTVDIESSGDLNLNAIAEINDDDRGNIFVVDQQPGNLHISGLTTDNPQMTGQFKSALSAALVSFSERHWSMASSIIFYHENPEMFSPDSVAGLSSNAYALVNSYDDILIQSRADRKQQEQTIERRTKSRNSWLVSLFFIPFALTLFLAFTVNNKNILEKAKTIAIVQGITLVAFVVTSMGLYTYWWLIVLWVIAFLIINVINILIFLNLKEYVNMSIGEKYPVLPAIVFGYVGMLSLSVPLALIVIILDLANVINVDINIPAMLGVAVATVAVVVLLGRWYKNSLAKRSPELGAKIVPIAIMTIMTAVAILALIFFIIALFIFKHTARDFLKAGIAASKGSDVKMAESGGQSCATCERLGDSTCPNFRQEANSALSCNSWTHR